MSQANSTEATQHKFNKGELVKGLDNGRIYRICSVSEWSASSYSSPAKYNLCDYATGQIRAQKAKLIAPLVGQELDRIQNEIRAKALREIEASRKEFIRRQEKQHEANRLRILNKMLAVPERTRRMGRAIIGERVNEIELRQLSDFLIPRYRVTHCWECRHDLNNLEYDACPCCGWIKCPCGACEYNCKHGN